MTTEPKFCRDCKWARPTTWHKIAFLRNRYEFAKCGHAQSLEQSENFLVDGVKDYSYCSTMRKCDCGREGKLWEPKEKL